MTDVRTDEQKRHDANLWGGCLLCASPLATVTTMHADGIHPARIATVCLSCDDDENPSPGQVATQWGDNR